jgi:cyanophycin synthetase
MSQAEMQAYWDYPLDPGPLKVQEIKTMHGANYFSGGPIVVIRLDLAAYDEVFTNAIPGFYEGLAAALPTLAEHQCSEKRPGGFFFRVETGTLLGHVVEHTAIELQTLAGMDVGYGKTRSTSVQGVYNVVFRFLDEVAGVYAGKAAVNLINALLEGRPFDTAAAVQTLVEIREKRLLGPSTQAIVDEAAARQIPWLRLDAYNLVQLGTGRYRKWVRATITSDTSIIAVETADDKALTAKVLADAGVPVPETLRAVRAEEAAAFQRRCGGPVVLKPVRGALGTGVTLGVEGPEAVAEAFALAQREGGGVLVQPLIAGKAYRLLVIDYRFAAAVQLVPPYVIGDGATPLSALVERLNADPRRGFGDKSLLSRVEVTPETLRLLARKGYTLDSVPPKGEVVVLALSGNPKVGGSAVDVTDAVHPVNRFLAERAARAVGLNVAGVDCVAEDIGESILESGGKFLEVNAAPDFRMHLRPTAGKPRPVAGALLDMLFPPGTPARIPLFSVTGTLGKTTAVALLSHCLALAGRTVGTTTTEGLFIGGRCLMKGDMTYPEHVALVLKDPAIDCAVLETAREGILRRGLGYEYADCGIVLNLHDDHVGSDDIKYLEDLAYAKSVVAEQVYPQGCAVLNADNELVMEMASRVRSRLALFSHRASNPAVGAHAQGGGPAVVLDGDRVVVLDGPRRMVLMPLAEIPLAFAGRASINIDALLAATAALHAHGLAPEAIREGLRSFLPDPEHLPGRMNLLKVKDFEVLLDYAHNAASFASLQAFLRQVSGEKLGVLDAAGDRSDEEIRALGAMAGRTYDEIYLFEGYDLRGRAEGEVLRLLREGVLSSGFPEGRLREFRDPEAAWRMALVKGRPGRLVVILSPRAEATLQVIRAFEEGGAGPEPVRPPRPAP